MSPVTAGDIVARLAPNEATHLLHLLERVTTPALPAPPLDTFTIIERTLYALHWSGRTVVVNRHHQGPHARLWRWAESAGVAVYIGNKNGRARAEQSVWDNPHKIAAPERPGDRIRVIEAYVDRLRADRSLALTVKTLRGKVLGCWCKPQDCHGDVLAAMADTA